VRTTDISRKIVPEHSLYLLKNDVDQQLTEASNRSELRMENTMLTWVLGAVAVIGAVIFVATMADTAWQISPANESARFSAVTLYGECAAATDRVRILLAVPTAARDAEWATELGQQLPRASFRMLGEAPSIGPNGFPCLPVSTSFYDDAHQGFGGVVQSALDGGFGVVINPNTHGADLEVSFGALATYAMFGAWRVPEEWIGGEVALGIEVLQRSEEIVIASPNEDYLPQFVRKALRRYLKSAGVRDPRVLIVVWPGRGNHRDLAFNIERASFLTSEHYEKFMYSLSWFLPNGYQYVGWEDLKAGRFGALEL
jgi:hypothetical protein